MSNENKENRPASLWKLELYFGDEPAVLVEYGFNAIHAQKRMLGSLRSGKLHEHPFPGSRLSLRTAIEYPKALQVWNGYFDDKGQKVWVPADNLFDAINQGWLERCNGALFMA